MNTSFTSLAALALGAALLAWAPAASAQELKAQPNQKFALLMSHMSNEFTVELSGAVKEKAEELGASLNVFDARNEIARQISQVETVVTQGYTGLVFEPVAIDGLAPALAAAKKAGLVVINVNQKVANTEVIDSYVGANPIEGGEIEMDFVAKAIGGKGNVAFLLGPLGSDGQIGRTQGYENILKNYPDIKVVYKQTANWRTDQALKLAENWLQTGTEITAIVSNNDDMALGAVKAVKDAQLVGKVVIAGVDAAPNGLAAVKEGTMAATVSQNTVEQGHKAMEALVQLANGQKIEPVITVPHELITKENVDQYIK
ncbi:Periplasmic binding protein/LacI transcriptional regulator [uncultured Pleomorphomonas sp.]|uniref:Periplasmic binding protein/LacI transcriptional regulator n=1 Tax=uncultured Pleomorphomonas sp. TaxID=442121 RepID=A0A212LH20_9HYPH|nr:substrate-binding domain-containing protein [uncultured Pleomorphomonas sp.]SCM76863.1 Periplasmic binding protein/LacI transcriptional regulator [uncultured Pleomorphomonas sp.]